MSAFASIEVFNLKSEIRMSKSERNQKSEPEPMPLRREDGTAEFGIREAIAKLLNCHKRTQTTQRKPLFVGSMSCSRSFGARFAITFRASAFGLRI
jgi:hypothetical protein